MGEGLAEAIGQALTQGPSSVGMVIGDQNGEVNRAMDWGFALARLGQSFPDLGELPVWNPAEAFGETGCASTGLAIGVATQAFQRGYAGCDTALVYCCSDTEERCAFVLSDTGSP